MIDLEIDDPAWTAVLADAERMIRAAADAVLADRAAVGRCVSLLLTNDASMRELNARFRNQDKPTNVLCFPAPPSPEHHLGDAALAFGVCAREADEQGKRLEHHLQHLVIHGVLHLLGYDHISEDEAEAMESLERIVLAGLGVPDPYAVSEERT